MSNLNTVVFNPITSRLSPISASYALNGGSGGGSSTSASWASASISSSYTITASYALNGGAAATTTFTTITTGSNLWITASLSDGDQLVNVTLGQLYNFTQSNMPTAGNSATCTLFFYNTADATSSLAFPPAWIFMGNAPTSITASRSAVLSLKAYYTQVVAGWSIQY